MAEQMVSVMELCVRRAVEVEPSRVKSGILAGHVAAFIDEWARMMRDTGNDDPTLAEWRAWAFASERTTYRRQSEFRLLFGEWHESPTVLARHMNRARKGDAVPAGLVPA